jgi:hypothetical protein
MSSTPGPSLKKITLGTLKCNDTEDWGSDGDEIRLDVFVDGAFRKSIRKQMKEDGQFYVNESFVFKKKVELKLWDEDSGGSDNDDLLGLCGIGPANTSSKGGVAQFRGDGASYDQYYAVVDAPPPPSASTPTLSPQLSAELAKFKEYVDDPARKSVWSKITKQQVFEDVRQAVLDPLTINQASTPLCGPATIAFLLARREPAKYARLCRELCEKGQMKFKTRAIVAEAELRNEPVKTKVSAGDWMFFTTLRDAENIWFDVDSHNPGEGIAGLTYAGAMEGWFSEILEMTKVTWLRTFSWGEISALKAARDAVSSGGVAALLIDNNLIPRPNSAESTIAYPDHWVPFLGNCTIGNDRVSFDCFSWDQIYSLDVSHSRLEDYLFGVVTGTK